MKSPLLLGLLLVLAGCTEPNPVPPSLPALATVAVDNCAGVGTAAILRGDAADPKVAWIERFPGGGHRQDVVWPEGFSARFSPGLEILDPAGRVVLKDGDFIDGNCGNVGARVLLLPPFLALRLDCGPIDLWFCPLAARQAASANGWPEREVAEVRFIAADGRYRLVFEDGTEVTGSSTLP